MKFRHGRLRLAAALGVALAVFALAAPRALAQDDREEIAKNAAILKDTSKDENAKIQAATILVYHLNKNNRSDALAHLKEVLGADGAAIVPANVTPLLEVLETQGIAEPLNSPVVALLGSGNEEVRKAAEKALTSEENRKSDKLYKAIFAALKEKSSPDILRLAAARIVGNSGRASACGELIEVLNVDGGLKSELRIEIIRSLGKLGELAAVEPLINLLDDPDKAAGAEARNSLKKLTYRDFGMDKKKWEEFWAAKRQRTPQDLREDSIKIHQQDRAEEMAAALKDKPSFETVMRVFSVSPLGLTPAEKFGERYPALVGAAVEVLLKIELEQKDFDQVIVRLDESLDSDDVRVRRAVLDYYTNTSAKVRQRSQSIKPLLARYLDAAEDEAIRDLALDALKKVIGKTRTAPGPLNVEAALLAALQKAMSDTIEGSKQERRLQAVEILGAGLRTRDGLMWLAKMLEFKDKPSEKKEDVELRDRIAFSIDPVLEGMNGESLSENDRLYLAATLGRTFLKDAAVAPKYARLLANLRYEGVIEIDKIKYNGVSDLLERQLYDGAERGLKESVLEAFSRLPGERTETAIIERAVKNPKVIDPNENAAHTLMEVAIETLGEVGREKAFSYLLESQTGGGIQKKTVVAAWSAVSAIAKRLLAAGKCDFLLDAENAVALAGKDAPPEARNKVDETSAAIASAREPLEKKKVEIRQNIADLAGADAARAQEIRNYFDRELGLNRKTVLLELVESLNPAAGNPEATTRIVREILAKKLNRPDLATASYDAWKSLVEGILGIAP